MSKNKRKFYWAIETRQMDQSEFLAVCRATIISLQQTLRLIAVKAFNVNELVLGGNGKIVEVDESLFIKVKHHKGKDMKR